MIKSKENNLFYYDVVFDLFHYTKLLKMNKSILTDRVKHK